MGAAVLLLLGIFWLAVPIRLTRTNSTGNDR